MAAQLATAPGMVTESMPRLGGFTVSAPYFCLKYAGVQALGARPEALRPCSSLPSQMMAKRVATQAVADGFDNRHHRCGSDGGINRIAAVLQHPQASLRG